MNFPSVLSAVQMRQFDLDATARTGLPSLILMENAGRGVAEVVRARRPPREGRPLVVCVPCGGGNNGGDGFVVARHLAKAAGAPDGYDIRVLLATERAKVTGDAAVMLRALEGLSGVAIQERATASAEAWIQALAGADVIVDALLGTGLREDVRGVAAAAIRAVNASAAFKVAVDIPSGSDADTGVPHGEATRVDITVTMGARKLGLLLDPTVGAGEVVVAPLGVPVEAPAGSGPCAFWIDEAGARGLLPVRHATAYKGDGGHLVIVAGSAGKSGAAWLAARAAMRAGAGLVSIASTAAGQAALDAKVEEAMTVSYAAGADADAGSFAAIAALLARPQVRGLALGPGIPTGPGMRELVERLVTEVKVAMVVDADGLNLLGDRAAAILAAAQGPRVVTPHPGEMARLVARSSSEVQRDRLATARGFAEKSRAVVVLKGPRTLIATPDGQVFINPAVEPALGTAGSGDVLTGMTGAFLAQGLAALPAAIVAVYVHGRAGRLVAAAHGAPGAIAGDLPDAVASVRATLAAGTAR